MLLHGSAIAAVAILARKGVKAIARKVEEHRHNKWRKEMENKRHEDQKHLKSPNVENDS